MPKAQSKVSSSISRRKFLLAATAGTAATAAAIVGRKTDDANTDAKDGAAPGGKGYHVTEHIQNYYRTARI